MAQSRQNKIAVQDAIEWYLNTTHKGLIMQMQEKGFWVTGRTAGALKVKVNTKGGSLETPNHFSTLIKGIGRRPGKFPPLQAIIGWVARRNLELKPFLVARKMAEEGNSVYRGTREGIDVQGEMQEHKEEFKKRIKAAFFGSIKDKIKQVKKDGTNSK